MRLSRCVSLVVCVGLTAFSVFGSEVLSSRADGVWFNSSDRGAAANGGCYPTPPDLLAFWTANSIATDVAGFYSGLVEGGTGFGPGMVGNAFDFPGTPGSWVYVDPAPTSESFTVEGWVFLASEVSGYQTLYAHGHGFWLSDRKLNWWHSGVVYLGTSVLSVGAWHHVAITYDSSTDTLSGYVDGIPDGTVIHSPVGLPSSALMGNNDSAEEPVDGLIDEMSVYGRALEPSEIEGIFTAGSSGKCLIFNGHFESGNTSRW